MSKASCFLLLALAAGLMASPAQAVMMSLVGGANLSKTVVTSTPATPSFLGQTTGNQLGYEGGLLLNFRMGMAPLTIELGGLYDHHKQSGASGLIETNEFQIPADLRLWFTRYFSIGAGGYYAFATGNLSETDASGGSLYNGSYSGRLKSNDYGALGSVRLGFPMAMMHWFVDGRYLYGLKNLNDTGDGSSYELREYQVLLGISFRLR